MRRASILFLRTAIVVLGIGTLVAMLGEPHLEGRNAGATPFEIYFRDPFLAYAYTASLAFFTVLYQAFKLLGLVGKDDIPSAAAARALRIIRYCALTLIASIGAAVVYAFLFVRGEDDITGGVALGLLMILIASVVAASAAVLEHVARRSESAPGTRTHSGFIS